MDGTFCEHCKLTIFNYHFVIIRSEMQVQDQPLTGCVVC